VRKPKAMARRTFSKPCQCISGTFAAILQGSLYYA
jgi:hypothetical protein